MPTIFRYRPKLFKVDNQERAKVLDCVIAQKLRRDQAATLLHLSTRQVSRLLQRYKLEGKAGLEHRLKNRPSNNCKNSKAKKKRSRGAKKVS
ncbi:MAG: helix-turn-helix domain-containing protein [Deltaproteobacteria bacterium]|jgi:transposase|nr:helix-turn-helix domain-containing protein [Deltaproteobacteria bacterium]